MKQTHELMGGVTVEMGAETIELHGVYQGLAEEYKAAKGMLEEALPVRTSNLMFYAVATFLLGTDGMTIPDDCALGFADDLHTFAGMVKNHKPAIEWVEFFEKKIHLEFFKEWEQAWHKMNVAMIPVDRRPGHLLTEEEKEDPK